MFRYEYWEDELLIRRVNRGGVISFALFKVIASLFLFSVAIYSLFQAFSFTSYDSNFVTIAFSSFIAFVGLGASIIFFKSFLLNLFWKLRIKDGKISKKDYFNRWEVIYGIDSIGLFARKSTIENTEYYYWEVNLQNSRKNKQFVIATSTATKKESETIRKYEEYHKLAETIAKMSLKELEINKEVEFSDLTKVDRSLIE